MKLYMILSSIAVLAMGAALYMMTEMTFNDDYSCFDNQVQAKFTVKNFRAEVMGCSTCNKGMCQKPSVDDCFGLYHYVKLKTLSSLCVPLVSEPVVPATPTATE